MRGMKPDHLSPERIHQLISNSPAPLTRRDMIQAFGLRGEEQRIALKRLLKAMEEDGKIVKQAGQTYAIPDALPEIGIIEISEIGIDINIICH